MYDNINASFEIFAALVLLDNIRIILKDKIVKGVSLLPSFVFCIWGMWNIFYYSHLDQTTSAYAAGFVALANSIWLGLVLYYRCRHE